MQMLKLFLCCVAGVTLTGATLLSRAAFNGGAQSRAQSMPEECLQLKHEQAATTCEHRGEVLSRRKVRFDVNDCIRTEYQEAIPLCQGFKG